MKEMTKGSPLRLILTFAFPLLLGNVLQQLYNVADAAIVGRFLGPDALAAVGATSSVQFLILGFCIGTCSGFCVPVAQKFGARNYKGMRILLYNSIVLTGIIAAVVTVLCVVLCNGILQVLSTPESIWADTHSYILVIFIGIPFTLLYNLAAGILRAIGDSRTPFLILAVSAVSNIFLDIFCIAVLGWGCAGAAIATVGSQALSGILCTWFIIRKDEILHIRKEEMKLERHRVHQLLAIGVPMGLQFSITAIGSMVMQSANNALGSLYASAFTAAVRIKQFAMCPFDAIASGVATFTSQNYGAGNYQRIKSGVWIGTLVSVVYALAIGILMVLSGRSVCLIFLSSDQGRILDAAKQYLDQQGYFFWILGFLGVARITVQGLGYSGRAMFSGVMEMIARTAIVLLLVPSMGYHAICLADPAAWAAADLYILPTCALVLSKVRKDLAARAARTTTAGPAHAL
jgi:putative MATE family efflux protein